MLQVTFLPCTFTQIYLINNWLRQMFFPLFSPTKTKALQTLVQVTAEHNCIAAAKGSFFLVLSSLHSLFLAPRLSSPFPPLLLPLIRLQSSQAGDSLLSAIQPLHPGCFLANLLVPITYVQREKSSLPISKIRSAICSNAHLNRC